jgi:hypothetical protein
MAKKKPAVDTSFNFGANAARPRQQGGGRKRSTGGGRKRSSNGGNPGARLRGGQGGGS